MLWRTVLGTSMDGTSGWERGQKQEASAGAVRGAGAALPGSRVPPGAPMRAGISWTSIASTLFSLALGNAFSPVHCPSDIMLRSSFFLLWLPHADLCFLSHGASLVFVSSKINYISLLYRPPVAWLLSACRLIQFREVKPDRFCAPFQLPQIVKDCSLLSIEDLTTYSVFFGLCLAVSVH